jgi:hypothetical protein
MFIYGLSTIHAAAAHLRLPLHCSFLFSFHSPLRGPQTGYHTGVIRLCMKSRQSPPDRGSHCIRISFFFTLTSPRPSGGVSRGRYSTLSEVKAVAARLRFTLHLSFPWSCFFTLTLLQPSDGVLHGRYTTSSEV